MAAVDQRTGRVLGEASEAAAVPAAPVDQRTGQPVQFGVRIPTPALAEQERVKAENRAREEQRRRVSEAERQTGRPRIGMPAKSADQRPAPPARLTDEEAEERLLQRARSAAAARDAGERRLPAPPGVVDQRQARGEGS